MRYGDLHVLNDDILSHDGNVANIGELVREVMAETLVDLVEAPEDKVYGNQAIRLL